MGFEYGGLLGLIILALDVWAIVTILQGRGPTGNKVLWIVLILVLPVIGLIIWLLAGRGR
jgi:Phospholipase_D-nuclease N-terminal